MRERLIATFLLAAAALLSHAPANAAVIRCGDASGNTLYTDSACPAGMRAVGVASFPPSCTTQECKQRRERELREGYERARTEKELLAGYVTERSRRDLEYRQLEEARYEAQMLATEVSHASADEPIYSGYPIFGVPVRCGMHCISFPRHRHPPAHGIGDADRGHRGIRNAGKRAVGDEPPGLLRAMTGRRPILPDR